MANTLLNQLNQTQLSQKDNPLYQVIKGLIDAFNVLSNSTSTDGSGGSGSTIVNLTEIKQFISDGDGGGSGDDGPPGVRGADGAIGATGAQGPPFPAFYSLDGTDGEDALGVPGPVGPTGNTGATGATGPPSFFIQTEDGPAGEDGMSIPGLAGAAGASSEWTLVTTITPSAINHDVNGLSGYSDILVIFVALTKSVSNLTLLRVSTDNGATFLSSSGDYVLVATTGVGTNATDIAIQTTAASVARSGFCTIQGFNKTGAKSVVTASANDNYIIPTTTALNAIRIVIASGVMNGGTIYVLGR